MLAREDSAAKNSEGRGLAELRRFLPGDAEQLADEFDMGDHISFACPSHPTFLIMSIASMSRKVRHAVRAEP
jgi:hypothetical protein